MGKLLRTIQLAAMILFVSAGLLLVACSLPFTGWKALSVQTGSMEPAINPGALVLVHRVSPDSLRKGDVITYAKAGSSVTITHRVQERRGLPNGPKQTIVKGDANQSADAPLYDTQIVGKVVGSVPYLGKALDALKKPWGLAVFVYLPALLIAISEIRLLVKRLTKIELEKQKAELKREASTIIQPMRMALAPISPIGPTRIEIIQPEEAEIEPILPEVEKTSKEPSGKRIAGRVGAFLVPVLAFSLVAPTLALLDSEATLTDNVISTAEVVPPPNPLAQVLIDRVDFPWEKKVSDDKDRHDKHRSHDRWDHDDHDQPDPVAIYLYTAKRWKNVDIKGWTISSTSGVLYTVTNKDRKHDKDHDNRLIIKLKRSQKLNITGDFLVLKDSGGNVIDALSWGTNTTYLNPSIQGIEPNDDIKRIRHADTDTAKDWFIIP